MKNKELKSYKKCPKCGGRKPTLMACLDCGFSRLHQKLKTNVCPRCGANASKKHIDLGNCKPLVPHIDITGQSEDLFTKHKVLNGGGFGVGKGKK
jgi:ribosomal protein L32